MTDLRQAAQAVLERWDSPLWKTGTTVAAIADLRTALEQPKQEPSQWRDMVVVNLVREGINKHKARELADHFATAAQPEQVECPRCGHVCSQRPWQGLTEGERNDLEDYCKMTIGKVAFDAIEARLKERNT